jgi:chromosome segregation ATPase
MLSGFGFLVGEIAFLLALAVGVGALLGRFAWPSNGGGRLAVPPPAPAEAEASVRLDVAEQRVAQTESRLAESQASLAETRHKLSEAHAEILRMSSRAQAMADQKETEMGRLESGAIAALESTMTAHRKQIAELETTLQAAQEEARRQSQLLDVERGRTAQLQAALAERDAHLSSLTSQDRERRG